MSLVDLLKNTVEVWRETTDDEDDYGNDSGNYELLASSAARVQHHNSWEDKEGRSVSIQNWRVYLPPGTDVTEQDQLLWTDVSPNRRFEILVVEPVYSPRGIHHQFCFLQEIF